MQRAGLKVRKCECTDECEPCIRGKMSRKSFSASKDTGTESLDLVVSDVCGPITPGTMAQKRYFITFIDSYTDYCEVRLMKEKGEAAEEVIRYVERMKTQLGRKPKIFRTDRGKEYLNDRLQKYFEQEGIRVEYTVGYCPEQNGKAERRNRTLMEAVRTMLVESKLPLNHWGEALYTANHMQNRIINEKTGKTPYEAMFSKEPRWNDMRQFGCEVMVMIPKEKRKKLDQKAKKMKFVGFDTRSDVR
jgi:transposase InsO family protein